MLGRKTYTPEELDSARAASERLSTAYRELADAVRTSGDERATAALEAFEPALFNDAALALDRRFVHRVRMVTGKDCTPLNELELLSESLMSNGGTLHTGTVISYSPNQAVLGLDAGEAIALSAGEYERLAAGTFDEVEAKFLER